MMLYVSGVGCRKELGRGVWRGRGMEGLSRKKDMKLPVFTSVAKSGYSRVQRESRNLQLGLLLLYSSLFLSFYLLL